MFIRKTVWMFVFIGTSLIVKSNVPWESRSANPVVRADGTAPPPPPFRPAPRLVADGTAPPPPPFRPAPRLVADGTAPPPPPSVHAAKAFAIPTPS